MRVLFEIEEVKVGRVITVRIGKAHHIVTYLDGKYVSMSSERGEEPFEEYRKGLVALSALIDNGVLLEMQEGQKGEHKMERFAVQIRKKGDNRKWSEIPVSEYLEGSDKYVRMHLDTKKAGDNDIVSIRFSKEGSLQGYYI